MTLTLNAVIIFFSQDTLAYDDVSSDQVWLLKNEQFRRHGTKESYFDHMKPRCDLDLEDSNKQTNKQKFCMTLAHDAASPYQIW